MVEAAVVLVGLIAAALAAATLYNQLQQKRRRCVEAWHHVQAELRRRWDLVPGAVEAVRRHSSGQGETLQRVLDARGLAMAAQGVQASSQAERVLRTSLDKALAIAEACPALKADGEFVRIREEMIRLSNRVAVTEQQYNEVVGEYNRAVALRYNRPVAAMFRLAPQVRSEIASGG